MTADRLLQIATNPLGLAGLALFLVFGVMSGVRKMPAWWPKVSASLAAFALLGGLGIAYFQVSKEAPPSGPTNTSRTMGDCAPAMATVNVGGSVDINCNRAKSPDNPVPGGAITDKPTAAMAKSGPKTSAGNTAETEGNNSPALAGVSVGGSLKIESNAGAGAKGSEDRSGGAKP